MSAHLLLSLTASSAWADVVAEREVFRELGTFGVVAFYVLAAATVGAFCWGCLRQVRKYRRGRPADRLTPLRPRLLSAMREIGSHVGIGRGDRYIGIAHALVFRSFAVLLIGTAIVALDEDGIQLVFGPDAKLLVGWVYLVFSALMDLAGLALVVGLVMMIVRRARFELPKLDYTRVDRPADTYDRSSYRRGDNVFVWLLLFIAVTGFAIEAARIGADMPDHEVWSFAGYALAGLGGDFVSSDGFFLGAWWIHVFAVFGFLGYLPSSKAMHMVTDVLSLASRDQVAAIALPPVVDEADPGITRMEDFSWRQLLSFDACTKCGRCHEVCPARTTGAPLSPRDVILDLREHSNRTFGVAEILGFSREPTDGPIAGSTVTADTLWSCTTCRHCVEICPVGVEHVVDIVQLRRSLVSQGEVADSLQDALRALDEKGNSFGESGRKRSAWSKPLGRKIPDATRKPVDVLWFVGDYASFNGSCVDGTRAFAEVLTTAGVDFGLLHRKEKSAGNDARRVGEEGLFEALATENIATLQGCEFQRIVTTDPHTFNTLKNEYPPFGGEFEVVHYATLLLELIRAGRVELPSASGSKATYHDPCYLGRYNGIYDEPREVLRACGVEVVEMPRNREDSFCCGAGGGRIWIPDPDSQTERPSENRIDEAVALGVDTFVVACPKDMTLFTDAVKTSGNEGRIVVRDLVELVAEAMSQDPQETDHG